MHMKCYLFVNVHGYMHMHDIHAHACEPLGIHMCAYTHPLGCLYEYICVVK